MTLTTRTLTNTGDPLCAPDGTLLAGVTITFTLVNPRGLPMDAWDAVSKERIVGIKSVTTDAQAEFSVQLWPTDRSNVPAQYLCHVGAPGVRNFLAALPSGDAPLSWAELMANGLPLTATQLDILDTYRAGFDAAAAAAAQSAADTLAIFGDATAVAAAVAQSDQNRVQTGQDSQATAADLLQTGQDRVATGQDRTATDADREQTRLDRDATAADRMHTDWDRVATGDDRAQTSQDRVATGQDRDATGQDRIATGQDRAAIAEVLTATGQDLVQTGRDRAATAADREQTGQDRTATGQDAMATDQDRQATASSAQQALERAEAAKLSQILSRAWAEEVLVDGAVMVPGPDGVLVDRRVLQGDERSAKHWAGEGQVSQGIAGSFASAAVDAAAQAKTAVNNAVAVVTGSTASLTPAAGKIPMADASGKIDPAWLDVLPGVTAQALHRSPNAVVAMCIYDTSKDSDGGAWRKRMQHTSWMGEPLCGKWLGAQASEAVARAATGATTGSYFQRTSDGKFYSLNTTSGITEVFRGNVAEFPALSAIVAEGTTGGYHKFVVYDLTAPGAPMWMVFVSMPNSYTDQPFMPGVSGSQVTSLAACNGRVIIGFTGMTDRYGYLRIASFAADSMQSYSNSTNKVSAAGISSRNTTLVGFPIEYAPMGSVAPGLANGVVNAVAAMVLPDAPIDPTTGLQVPTIVVGTEGGITVIKSDGTVLNKAWAPLYIGKLAVKGTMVYTSGGSSDSYLGNMAWDFATGAQYRYGSGGGNPTAPFVGSNSARGEVAAGGGKVFFNSKETSKYVSILKENAGNRGAGLVAYVALDYNTGWQVGDIRRCLLADIGAGVVTGPELVANGSFSTGINGWTSFGQTASPASWDSRGYLKVQDVGGADGGAGTPIETVVGKTYLILFTCVSSQGQALVLAGPTPGSGFELQASFTFGVVANQRFAFTFVAQRAQTYVSFMQAQADGTLLIDDVSVAEPVLDRSYKNKPLSIVGTLTKTAVALGAQLVGYSGFSDANYGREDYSADLDVGTGEVSVGAWLSYSQALASTFVERSFSSGTSIKLGTDAAGKLTAAVYDGTTTRTVTSPAAYNNGAWLNACARYSTGTLALDVNGVEVAKTLGAPLLSLSNPSAVLTIGNRFGGGAAFPGSLALVKLSATCPTPEQAAWMYAQELPLFREGVQCCLPDAGTVVDLAYDESQDKWRAISAANESAFVGLVRTQATPVSAGAFAKVEGKSGVKLLARSTTSPGVDISMPAMGLREELVRRAEAAAAASRTLTVFDFDAVVGQKDFALPLGWTATEVLSAGASKREGATKDFTRLFDGFRETIRFAVAPGAAAWVQITARKA